MSKRQQPTRKIAYVLGAGFSYGTGHRAPVGNHFIRMPTQDTLLQELCRFHYRKIKQLDKIASLIRQYFSPNTYRASRNKGSKRHEDIYGLSLEEVITFFYETISSKKAAPKIKIALTELQELITELIAYLSLNGKPGQNDVLRKFADRLFKTDVIITFNWDTILDRTLSNRLKFWHPRWGYGKSVKNEFKYNARHSLKVPQKYPRLLKLHGSINWTAHRWEIGSEEKLIAHAWGPDQRNFKDVVMIPPKMIKSEIFGDIPLDENRPEEFFGNEVISRDFYTKLWSEAENHLSISRRIVFVGYSFPPADYAFGNMLRRAISRMKISLGRFPGVDIVDPNAAELAKRFEKSFKISVPVENQYLSLKNYLSSPRPKAI